MLITGFSVQGTSLKLMRSHERGVITRIHSLCDRTTQKLMKLGLSRGQSITVEQRFPRFIIRLGNDLHALDETALKAIYVRIIEY